MVNSGGPTGNGGAAAVSSPGSVLRLRLDISYDGAAFSGWAAQPDRRTVAGCISAALNILFRTDVPLVVAGRTDAGVHATGQVAHIDVPSDGLVALAPRRPRTAEVSAEDGSARLCQGLVRRLAGLLPPDVRVRRVTMAPDGFDARFSALRRHYRYRVGVAEWGVDPLRRNDILARRRPLDVDAMGRAAAALLGLHDFAAFCRPRPGATTIRELQALTVAASGDEVHIDATADAFCHSMVRSLVGSLIAVGEHQVPVSRPAELLAGASRATGVHVAPANGLTLVAVDYPPDADLAERSRATRAVRRVIEAVDPTP